MASSSSSSSFIAFARHNQRLSQQVLLLIILVTTQLPHFVVSSFLSRSTPRVGVGRQEAPPPPPFVTYSFSTKTFERSISAVPFVLSSSSTSLLNAAAAGKGFQQQKQQQQDDKKELSLLSDLHDDDQEELSLSKASKTSGSSSSSGSGSTIYSKPALYDLAFGFRDYNAQVDFLLAQHLKYSTITTTTTNDDDRNDHDHNNDKAISVLFLGAGPARHALIALNHHHHDRDDDNDNDDDRNLLLPRVASVTCIDNCSDMVKYGKELAAEEQQQQQHESSAAAAAFRYLLADMRDFASLLLQLRREGSDENLFHTAWILMGSLQHLTTNTDVLQCFANVATSLHPGGTLILELPHPKEELLGGMVDCTRNSWHVPLEGDDDDDDNKNNNNNNNDAGQLDIIWGDENDEFDPISQIRKLTVSLELKEPAITTTTNQKKYGKNKKKSSTNTKVVQSVRQVIPIRLFTAQEIDALATCAGFQVVAMSGALEEDISVHDDAAYRLVCILRKL